MRKLGEKSKLIFSELEIFDVIVDELEGVLDSIA